MSKVYKIKNYKKWYEFLENINSKTDQELYDLVPDINKLIEEDILNKRDVHIITEKLINKRTFIEIAKEYDFSTSNARQLYVKGISNIRKYIYFTIEKGE